MNTLVLMLLAVLLLAPSVGFAKKSTDFQLLIQRARVAIETHENDEAETLIQRLKAEHPDNVRVLALEAELELGLHHPEQAKVLLERAHHIDPKNEDITDRLAEIDKLDAPTASVEAALRETGSDASEKIQRIKGQGKINSQVAAGIVLENDFIHADPLLVSSGETKKFDTTRQRMEAYGLFDVAAGQQAKASVYLGNGVAGAGAQFQWKGMNGTTLVEANYQRPNWDDFIVSIVDEGAKDNVKLSRSQLLLRGLTGSINAGFNHYSLKDDSDAASTIGFGTGLAYEFDEVGVNKVLGHGSSLIFNYDLEAEYALEKRVEHSAVNPNFQSLGFQDRQAHIFVLNAGKEFNDTLSFHGYSGYSWDVLGDSGVMLGGDVQYQATDALGVKVQASRGTLRQGSVDELGVKLNWKFL